MILLRVVHNTAPSLFRYCSRDYHVQHSVFLCPCGTQFGTFPRSNWRDDVSKQYFSTPLKGEKNVNLILLEVKKSTLLLRLRDSNSNSIWMRRWLKDHRGYRKRCGGNPAVWLQWKWEMSRLWELGSISLTQQTLISELIIWNIRESFCSLVCPPVHLQYERVVQYFLFHTSRRQCGSGLSPSPPFMLLKCSWWRIQWLLGHPRSCLNIDTCPTFRYLRLGIETQRPLNKTSVFALLSEQTKNSSSVLQLQDCMWASAGLHCFCYSTFTLHCYRRSFFLLRSLNSSQQ